MLETLMTIVFTVMVIGAVALFCEYRENAVRVVYMTSKIRGPTIWEELTVHMNDFLSKDMISYTWKMSAAYKYKPWGLWMYHRYGIFVTDTNAVREVFRNKHMSDKSNFFYEKFDNFFGNGMFKINGPKYKRHRQIIKPAFRQSLLETKVLQQANKDAAKLVDRLDRNANGQGFSVRSFVEDQALELSFLLFTAGASTYRNYRHYSKVTHFAMSQILVKATKPFYYWLWHEFKISTIRGEAAITGLLQELKKLFFDLKSNILKQMTDDWEPSSVFDMMVKASKERKEGFTDEELFAEARTVIIAGSETTAIAMNIFLILLALHPDVQERVHQELESIFGQSDREVEPDDLAKMIYLEMAIKETLRLFPPVPAIGRQVDEETTLRGTIIPKGCTILINIFALHRNPDNFTDPLKFNPDRFAPSTKPVPFSYVPFSYGLRSCPGQVQAFMMMKTLMSNVLRNFKILPGDGLKSMDDIKVKMAMTLHLTKPVHLRLIRRRNARVPDCKVI